MESNFKIRTLKSQIENMKLQIENIEIQNSNMQMMNNSQKGDQLLNLGIQMLNAGIQSFEIAEEYMIMNKKNFYEQLQKISEEINLIINKYNMDQQMMMQQKMMMQQQMMAQQMIMQQQMMQPNLMAEPIINQQEHKMTITFRNPRTKYENITVKYGTTIQELFFKYLDKSENNKEIYNKKLRFIFNAKVIDKNEQRVVEDFFKWHPNPCIIVLED